MIKKHNLNVGRKMEILNPNNIPNLLKKGEVGAVLEWEVKDSAGKVSSRGQQRAKSFVKAFMQILFSHMSGQVSSNDRDDRLILNLWTTAWVQCTAWYSNLYMEAAAGSYAGMVVGSSSTAPTINDNAMGVLISTGTSAGQLAYAACTLAAPASTVSTSQFTVTRNFANSSGGDVTVYEIGIHAQFGTSVTSDYALILRDVISGGIVVPNGQTLTVNYRIQAVV